MEKKDVKVNSKYDDKDNKLSYDPLTRQIDDDTFEIRKTIELRRLGIYKIILTKNRLTIDTYEDTIVTVTNYKDVHELYNRLEDQLANDDMYMSPQFLDELWSFLKKAKTSIGKIIEFFQNQELKGASV